MSLRLFRHRRKPILIATLSRSFHVGLPLPASNLELYSSHTLNVEALNLPFFRPRLDCFLVLG